MKNWRPSLTSGNIKEGGAVMCMTNRQVDNRLKKLQALEEQKKELETMIKALQEELKEDMGDLEEIETGHFLLRYTKVVSSRFDSAAFKKEHAKLYKELCRPAESRRFSYKETA